MASLGDKAQILKKIDALVKGANLSPHDLKNFFAEMGDSAEKLQAMLKVLFVPLFRPTFVGDPSLGAAGLQDIEFLSSTDTTRQKQLPFRMFDIETGNLVDFPSIGVLGQYCMLSHRWRGDEIKLSDIEDARQEDLELAQEAIRLSSGAAAGVDAARRQSARKDDVGRLLEKCERDVRKQEEVIKELAGDISVAGDVGDLLERRLTSKSVNAGFEWAKSNAAKARAQLGFAKMEGKIFETLISQMKKDIDKKMESSGITSQGETTQGGASSAPSASSASADSRAVSAVVESAESQVALADADRDAAEKAHAAVEGDLQFFAEHSRLREAVDEMVRVLQKWKSAIKLRDSIAQAREIFARNLFPRRERRYLWTDTCCIDKRNGGETSESIALMGDWYAHADFALVQLESRFVENEAIDVWKRFVGPRGEQDHGTPSIRAFELIGSDQQRPEWSERSWTLQELVMSKTTFYVSSGVVLRRPVESLGQFYHLIPYISLYCAADTQNIYAHAPNAGHESWNPTKLLEVSVDPSTSSFKARESDVETEHTNPPEDLENVESYDARPKAAAEAARIRKAHRLITILDGLGVEFPNDMSVETAKSDMAQAVYLAAINLTSGRTGGSSRRGLLTLVRSSLPEPATQAAEEQPEENEEQRSEKDQNEARHALNFLLKLLVDEVHGLIKEDRRYLAKFGEVRELQQWQKGTRRTGFPTQDVMSLLFNRKSTKPVDHVYSVMGVLGVQFPTFPAEGVPRALARLLDEVLINHNDVSVFNWTGIDMASPIRGRSLYPASHEAFGRDEQRSHRYNLLLSQEIQGKMLEVAAVYHSVIFLLRAAINFVKENKRKNFPLGWIRQVVEAVQFSALETLKPHLQNIAKIVGYILKHTGATAPPPPSPSSPPPAQSPTAAEPARPKGFAGLPGLPKDGASLASSLRPSLPGMPSMKDKKMPKFGLGKKKQAEPESPVITEPEPAAPPPPPVAVPEPVQQETTLPPKPLWESSDEGVQKYLKGLVAEATGKKNDADRTLPEAVAQVQFPIPDEPSTGSHSSSSKTQQPASMISPNPIIVNNAGIEGIFDIQRVIVTMIDHKKLRRQVAQAASPQQTISGWCSVSTGFARVVVNFACEARILERELDVVEAIENKVLKEQDKEEGKKRHDMLARGLLVTNIAERLKKNKGGAEAGSGSQPEAANGEGSKAAGAGDAEDAEPGADAKKEEEKKKAAQDKKDDNTEEERMVSRMINYIQEADLRLVAGEWVLARFSGVPGANWFLCHLELGSTHQFYGQRVATSAIDFHSSAPETGLVNVWQAYMDRKKRKMCYILYDYLNSKELAAESEDKLKEGAGFAKRGMELANFRPLSFQSGKSTASSDTATGKEEAGAASVSESADDDDDDEAAEEGPDLVSQLSDYGKAAGDAWKQGKLAAEAVGKFAFLAAVEKLLEMRGADLDQNLSTSVLKRTPKALQPAVENMNDNRNLLPSMFHSAKRIHMF